jgi:RNA polymerase sigma-70 factor, ECF subfamily
MAETATLRLLAPQPLETSRQRLERLYRACRDDVYAYVATVLRDRHLAEDVTAQAFERAFRRRRLFDPRRGSERAWLFAIARNAALDELRRRKHTVPAADARRPEEADRDGEQLESILRTATVLDAVLSLPPRERELIALKFHAALTNSEIARVLGVSESNAGTMLHRTIAKLRKACDEDD